MAGEWGHSGGALNELVEGDMISRKGARAECVGAPQGEQAQLREAGRCGERWHSTEWAESRAGRRWWGLEGEVAAWTPGAGHPCSGRGGLILEVWELWISGGVTWLGLNV